MSNPRAAKSGRVGEAISYVFSPSSRGSFEWLNKWDRKLRITPDNVVVVETAARKTDET